MRIVSLSFADDAFKRSKERYRAELEGTGVFDEIIFLQPEDLGYDFYKRHTPFIERVKRAHGHWIWKPYIICAQLEKMQDGDILVYGDAGNSITGTPEEFHTLVHSVVETPGIIADQHNRLGAHCKKDVIRRMGVNVDEYRYRPVAEANRIIIQNSLTMRTAMIDWYEACCDYRNIDDSESEEPNFPEFLFHRHDQSVFSVVFNKYDGELVDFRGIWACTRIRDTDIGMDSLTSSPDSL
jgi:hypothetical protein